MFRFLFTKKKECKENFKGKECNENFQGNTFDRASMLLKPYKECVEEILLSSKTYLDDMIPLCIGNYEVYKELLSFLKTTESGLKKIKLMDTCLELCQIQIKNAGTEQQREKATTDLEDYKNALKQFNNFKVNVDNTKNVSLQKKS